MESFNEDAVMKLRSKIETTFREFMIDSAKLKVKAAARRSRQHTLKLTKLMKEYREISIK